MTEAETLKQAYENIKAELQRRESDGDVFAENIVGLFELWELGWRPGQALPTEPDPGGGEPCNVIPFRRAA